MAIGEFASISSKWLLLHVLCVCGIAPCCAVLISGSVRYHSVRFKACCLLDWSAMKSSNSFCLKYLFTLSPVLTGNIFYKVLDFCIKCLCILNVWYYRLAYEIAAQKNLAFDLLAVWYQEEMFVLHSVHWMGGTIQPLNGLRVSSSTSEFAQAGTEIPTDRQCVGSTRVGRTWT